MKKFLIVAVFALSLTACGEVSEDSSTPSEDSGSDYYEDDGGSGLYLPYNGGGPRFGIEIGPGIYYGPGSSGPQFGYGF